MSTPPPMYDLMTVEDTRAGVIYIEVNRKQLAAMLAARQLGL